MRSSTYGSSIVGLAKISINPGDRSRVDNTATVLLYHMRPCGTTDLMSASEMDSQHRIPYLEVTFVKPLSRKIPALFNNYVDTLKGIDASADNALSVTGSVT
jgi:hypothetical protein